jgi:hypothetical protein
VGKRSGALFGLTSCTSTAGTGTGTIVCTYAPTGGPLNGGSLWQTFQTTNVDPIAGTGQTLDFVNLTGTSTGVANINNSTRSPSAINTTANTLTVSGLTLSTSETVSQPTTACGSYTCYTANAYETYEGCSEYLGFANFGFTHAYYGFCLYALSGVDILRAECDTEYGVCFDLNSPQGSVPSVIHDILFHQNWAAIGSTASPYTASWQVGVNLPASSAAPITIENSATSSSTYTNEIGANYANFSYSTGVADNIVLPPWVHITDRLQDGTKSTRTNLYLNPLGVLTDSAAVTATLGSPILNTWSWALAHGTSTRTLSLVPAVAGQYFTIEYSQDSTGGAAVTAGNCNGSATTWRLNTGSGYVIQSSGWTMSIQSAASKFGVISGWFDGTYCYVSVN